MKTLSLKTIYTLLICTVIFFGCSKDNNGDSSGDGDEFLTAKVEGTAFNSNSLTVAASLNGNILLIQGSDNDGKAIRLNIVNYTGPGTFTTGDNLSNVNSANYITVTPVASWSSSFNIGSGTIKITSEADGAVEGTFTFTGYNAQDKTNKNVTEGKFKAILQ